MLKLKPIPPKNASTTIAAVYQDIQHVLNIESVPLIFQYIANYEQYFLFLWDRMKINIQATSFVNSCHNINTFTIQAIDVLYTPSPILQDFIKHIHPLEKQHIIETVMMLERVNTALLLLLIDLRESMKTIFIGTTRLTQYASEKRGESFEEFMQQETSITTQTSHQNEITEASKMLAPLFGTNSLVVSQYPDFFVKIAMEMEHIKNTELYLKSRVALEHLSLKIITQLVQPLGVSYQEFLTLTHDKPYINELLYMITDSFPSQFPHLVFTTALMKQVLSPEKKYQMQKS